MATNVYTQLQDVTSEQRLIEDLTIESIQMYGHDVAYIPRVTVEEDSIFGEDPLQKFTKYFMLEAYINSVDGFEGEGDFVSKFGLEIRDSVVFSIAVRRFDEEVPTNDRPFEGDLIYMPLSGGLFEIKFVEHENPFYQIGKLHTYRLSCELFRYSGEEVDVGLGAVDVIEKVQADTQTLVLIADEIKQEDGTTDNLLFGDYILLEKLVGNILSEETPSDNYTIDEEVYQGASLSTATARGEVTEWIPGSRSMQVKVTSGTFKSSIQNHLLADPSLDDEDRILNEDGDLYELEEYESRLVGATSGTVYNVFSISDTVPDQGEYGDNAAIEAAADDILDFSETNPFGVIGNSVEFEI